MLNKQSLHILLDLDLPKGFPVVYIYSEFKTERLDYVCRFIFNHVLKLNYIITTDLSAFKTSGDLLINYSRTQIQGIFQVTPASLLSEAGIKETKPEPAFGNDMIYFYDNEGSADFMYDVFSATFYFISRYEEWQSFEPDKHQRFEATSSILFKNKFHLKPVVDIWLLELSEALQKFYPQLKLPEKKFKVISSIDVDNLYAYKHKGLLRTLGAVVKDIIKPDLKNLKERILVLTGKKKDPFDIYETASDFCFEKKIPLIYFFLFRTGTKHDRTVNPEAPAFETVFNTLKENHALIGLHPSYDSSVVPEILKKESDLLNKKTKEKITLSRQHYLRFNIRTTPGLLVQNGFDADFSMGFASELGFRAGTSHPFYYYDFNKEQSLPLLMVPFCAMDGVFNVYKLISPESALQEMLTIAKEVKKVNGLFISVFHERSFFDHLYQGFGTLYKNLHSELKEL